MGEGEGATKKSRRLEKPRSPCYRKQVPFWGSWLRTQVSLSWRDELQRHGPRGIAGDCVANASFAGETSVLGSEERRTRQFDSLQVRVALITFTLKKVKVEIQRKHAHLTNSYSL